MQSLFPWVRLMESANRPLAWGVCVDGGAMEATLRSALVAASPFMESQGLTDNVTVETDDWRYEG
jgi:hypothetical protein